MSTRNWISLCGVAGLLIGLSGAAAQPTGADALWGQASSLEEQGQYDQAATLYQQILSADPAAQRAAVQIGALEWKTGQAIQAVDTLEAAIAMNPFSLWASAGLYHLARACQDAHCPAVARDSVALLRQRFPDMPWTTQAEVIEAQLNGVDTTAAENTVTRELEADAIYKQALAAAAAKDYPGALQFLETVISTYPGTRTALRAQESKAFILTATQESEEALDTFQGIVDRVAPAAADSRISYEAQYRVAALHQRQHRKQEAAEQYSLLAARAIDPAVKSNALVQAAGARMEGLFQRHRGGQANQPADWEQVRAECRQIKKLGIAKPRELARAELMIVESFAWELATEETLAAAKEYIATHDAETYSSEVATAHLLYGEFLQRKGRQAEALPHFEWITKRFGESEVWAGLTTTQRAYYRVYDALRQSGAPADQVRAAGDVVLTRWPDSVYAGLIRTAMQRDEARVAADSSVGLSGSMP